MTLGDRFARRCCSHHSCIWHHLDGGGGVVDDRDDSVGFMVLPRENERVSNQFRRGWAAPHPPRLVTFRTFISLDFFGRSWIHGASKACDWYEINPTILLTLSHRIRQLFLIYEFQLRMQLTVTVTQCLRYTPRTHLPGDIAYASRRSEMTYRKRLMVRLSSVGLIPLESVESVVGRSTLSTDQRLSIDFIDFSEDWAGIAWIRGGRKTPWKPFWNHFLRRLNMEIKGSGFCK